MPQTEGHLPDCQGLAVDGLSLPDGEGAASSLSPCYVFRACFSGYMALTANGYTDSIFAATSQKWKPSGEHWPTNLASAIFTHASPFGAVSQPQEHHN